MKKSFTVSISILTGLLSIGTLVSCNKTKNDENTLNIVCLNKGYGDTWIKNLKEIWEKDNPNYKINLQATSTAASTISKNINSKSNTDDLYISVGNEWKTYAARGSFLALDDFILEEVDGTKIKDKVNDEYKESIYYTNSNNEKHVYRLPWTSGVGGIYYNAKMFEANNWTIPTTYEELLTLIETIKNANLPVKGSETSVVKPFVYTGKNSDYFDYAVFTWWSQLASQDEIKEFLKYESADSFDYTITNKAYSKLYEATKLWYNIFSNSDNYVSGSGDKTNHQAQQDFLNGNAAMMFNSDWVYSEMSKYTSDGTFPDDFSLKLMKTPTAPNAINLNTSYIVGEDQFIAIPKTSSKADLAKSFIKLMISNKGMENFTNTAYGLMAYKWDLSTYKTDNEYLTSLISYRSSLETTFTNYSSNPMYLSGIIDIWSTGSTRPFSGLLTTVKSVDTSFETIKKQANANWETWRKQAGL